MIDPSEVTRIANEIALPPPEAVSADPGNPCKTCGCEVYACAGQQQALRARAKKLEADLDRMRSDRDTWKQIATSFENSAYILERQRDEARARIAAMHE